MTLTETAMETSGAKSRSTIDRYNLHGVLGEVKLGFVGAIDPSTSPTQVQVGTQCH